MTKLTFKDLKQQLAKLQSNTNQDNRLDVLRNKPFWIWNKQEHLKQAVESNRSFSAVIADPINYCKISLVLITLQAITLYLIIK